MSLQENMYTLSSVTKQHRGNKPEVDSELEADKVIEVILDILIEPG